MSNVVDVAAGIEFTSAAQVAQLRRTTTRSGEKSVEVVYLITSAPANQAPSATLATWIWSHWHVENRCTGSATSPTGLPGHSPEPQTPDLTRDVTSTV